MITSIIVVFFVFNLMIFIHEFGHFITGKLSGMEIKEFAIGFGPKLVSKKYNNTCYSLRMIPLGGFNDIKIDPNNCSDSNSFYSKSLIKRLIVLASGSIFNIVSAFIALIILFNIYGTPVKTNIVSEIKDQSIAASYFKNNDQIIKLNDKNITNILDSNISKELNKKTLNFTILRNGEEKEFSIEKQQSDELGIFLLVERHPLSFSESISASCITINNIFDLTIDSIKNIFKNKVAATEVVSGPIGTVNMMYKADVELGFSGTIFMFVIISFSLGFMNLLPIPILDGGHILIQLIEFIRRKRLSQNQFKYFNYIGLTIVLCLFCLGTYSDVRRLFF